MAVLPLLAVIACTGAPAEAPASAPRVEPAPAPVAAPAATPAPVAEPAAAPPGEPAPADLPADLLPDLAALGVAAADLRSPPVQPHAPPASRPRPHLVVAGAVNPPADGPVDPLVILVRDDDDARLRRVVEGCTTLDHRCIVLACPPTAAGCVAGWQATWAELSTEEALVGHPAALAEALVASRHGRDELGTRLYEGVATPMGVTVEKRAIR